MRRVANLGLAVGIAAAFLLAACEGCAPKPTVPTGEAAERTVRLYVLSTVAGALEPCGCSKDQLGGVDRLAAYFTAEKARAAASLIVGAGPMLFLDPELGGDKSTQETWKAEAMARVFKDFGVAAWAPGANDWAAGAEALAKYRELSGAKLLGGNVEGAPGLEPSLVVERDGVKIGIVGVAAPGAAPGTQGLKTTSAEEAMRRGLADVKAKGATVLVGLAALPRGEALRLADAFPELHVLVLGKPIEKGELNDGLKTPELVGSTVVVETSNHLQTVSVVDLHLKPAAGGAGPVVFADAGGVAKADPLLSVSNRIRELEARINGWADDKNVRPEDLAARRADLEKLRAEKRALEAPVPPPAGSFFRYASVEVREGLGADPAAKAQLQAFYKRVNDHNKVAFADRVPPPVEAGKAGYLGVDACTDCHDDERKVWDGTAHAHAYKTLVDQSKEFNLDCVSCHVTGYGKPGGATVTHVEKLVNVGCEECHGPGSLHAKDPGKKGLILTKPDPQTCVSACHHPPHVEGFDPVAKTKLILGPGHGT